MADYERLRTQQAVALEALRTPDALATAGVLLTPKRNPESLAQLERAAALAPQRSEIVYLQWRACASVECPGEAHFIAELKLVDPGNAIAWMPELNAALNSGDQDAVTRVLEAMGATRGFDIYWNKSVVMMVDALGDATVQAATAWRPSLPERMVSSIGFLAAMSVPPVQPLSKACRRAQLDQPGRRAACEAMVARLDQSDTVILQMSGVAIERGWWPEGSPRRMELQAQRQQSDYLMQASSKTRPLHMSKDWAVRLDAMRKNRTEAQVEMAMLTFYHQSLERPLDWKDAYQR